MFLCLPPTIWLSLVLPALDISDWSLSFLRSWCDQGPGILDPVILAVLEHIGFQCPLGAKGLAAEIAPKLNPHRLEGA